MPSQNVTLYLRSAIILKSPTTLRECCTKLPTFIKTHYFQVILWLRISTQLFLFLSLHLLQLPKVTICLRLIYQIVSSLEIGIVSCSKKISESQAENHILEF